MTSLTLRGYDAWGDPRGAPVHSSHGHPDALRPCRCRLDAAVLRPRITRGCLRPAFAGSCMASAAHGVASGAWPFGIVESVWSVIAFVRWRRRLRETAAQSQ